MCKTVIYAGKWWYSQAIGLAVMVYGGIQVVRKKRIFSDSGKIAAKGQKAVIWGYILIFVFGVGLIYTLINREHAVVSITWTGKNLLEK